MSARTDLSSKTWVSREDALPELWFRSSCLPCPDQSITGATPRSISPPFPIVTLPSPFLNSTPIDYTYIRSLIEYSWKKNWSISQLTCIFHFFSNLLNHIHIRYQIRQQWVRPWEWSIHLLQHFVWDTRTFFTPLFRLLLEMTFYYSLTQLAVRSKVCVFRRSCAAWYFDFASRIFGSCMPARPHEKRTQMLQHRSYSR